MCALVTLFILMIKDLTKKLRDRRRGSFWLILFFEDTDHHWLQESESSIFLQVFFSICLVKMICLLVSWH